MTELLVAGLLPEMAGDVGVSVAQAGLSITVFAVGMIVGAPLMAMLTLRLPRRLTLLLALAVVAAGHVVVAAGAGFSALLGARFLTALAAGAFTTSHHGRRTSNGGRGHDEQDADSAGGGAGHVGLGRQRRGGRRLFRQSADRVRPARGRR
ncbi:MFS transporter [Actinacidiphila oryziradicis]|uniref:MFS transporter n=1 Tax=Actinacidiphila oryziradicis TaxID=2571141 RepID=UPI001FE8EDF1|nr:MFS transporter [Actinacidiphila oryziradicis]